MSDKTLFNQDLTLTSLTLNNSTSSNASGYALSTSTFSGNSISTPTVNTASVNFNGANVTGNPRLTAANDDVYAITQTGGSLILQTPTASCSLTTSQTNYLSVPNLSTTSLILGTGANTVSLICPLNNNLTILGGTVNASYLNLVNSLSAVTVSSTNYTNVYYGNATNLTWTAQAGANTFSLSGIGFASSPSTAAIVTINITGSNAQGVFVGACPITATGATTTLGVQIYNVTASPITVFEVSFMLYNPNGFGGVA
jgi:hypothetical protein